MPALIKNGSPRVVSVCFLDTILKIDNTTTTTKLSPTKITLAGQPITKAKTPPKTVSPVSKNLSR